MTLLHLIRFISFEVYIEKNEFSYILSEDLLNKLSRYYNHLGINLEDFQFKCLEFERYSAKDYIDDEVLCENYLSFCANFEEAPAPAFLIVIYFTNNVKKVIKVQKDVIIMNLDNLITYIDFLVLTEATEYIN
ncbi:MAG: hypothetical protein ACFFBP_06765 [Promethearchaeota archaeon]